MVSFVRKVFYLIGLALAAYIGCQFYIYLFDRSCPKIDILGLEDGCYYAGDVSCSIQGADRYKVANIAVWLDGHSIVDRVKIGASSFERPLEIDRDRRW